MKSYSIKSIVKAVIGHLQFKFGTYEDKTKDAHPRTTNIDEDIDKVVERGRD